VIPVEEQPEPNDFNEKVRVPGADFLRTNPKPDSWRSKEYWRRSLEDLHKAYNGICSYCAHWIPCDTGAATVDHFIPKSRAPQLAYEWSNFRLAASKMNSRKRDYQDVLDPFTLEANSFILEFPSLIIKPNPVLNNERKSKASKTIARLKLNTNESSVKARFHWLMCYCDGEITFEHLEKNAPFIATELIRQGLQLQIIAIMKEKPKF
jgi:uncharacterized protein (TIGR02646 family)